MTTTAPEPVDAELLAAVTDLGTALRGLVVAPREELREACFGAMTDASGRHRSPGQPTDATAVET